MLTRLLIGLTGLVSLALPAVCHSAEALFYLGTFTSQASGKSGKSEGIYAGRLDTATGKLGPITLAAKAREPWFIAVSLDGKRVYSTLELPPDAPEAEGVARAGAVGAYRKRDDGTLESLNQKPSGGAIACHISNAGRHVLVANYAGGSIACFGTEEDGSLGERAAFHALTGSGPDPRRQEQPHPHSIYPSPDHRFVYVCDLGTDEVRGFKLDPARGTLTPFAAQAKAPPGSGPRHLAFSRDGVFVYTGNEMGLSVSVFSRDTATGALTLLQTLPTIPPEAPTKGVSVAEVIRHPSGKWLYVSNRGRDSLAVFAIGADGRLTWVEDAPAQVEIPWGFDIDPTGQWLVVAGQRDNRITVLKIDTATGKLTPTGHEAAVGGPVCVVFAPL